MATYYAHIKVHLIFADFSAITQMVRRFEKQKVPLPQVQVYL